MTQQHEMENMQYRCVITATTLGRGFPAPLWWWSEVKTLVFCLSTTFQCSQTKTVRPNI